MLPLIKKYPASRAALDETTAQFKTPSIKMMHECITWAWGFIYKEIINSFNKTGISDTIVGTEDDCLGGSEQR
jgi:hypothetical protein